VEVADFAEVEQALVELAPLVHVAAVHVVGQVVDLHEAGALQRLDVHRLEIHVVYRAVAVTIHEIDQRSTDTDDGRDVELHRSDLRTMRLGAELDGAFECRRRVAHAEGHGAYRRPVRLRETLAERSRLGVDHEVDVALRMQRHVLAAMPGDHREAEPFEKTPQQLRIWGRVFDEFESAGAHRVDFCGHDWPPAKKLVSIVTNGPPPETASRDFSALPAVGVVLYRQFGNRGGLLHELRTLDPRVARHGGARRQSRAV